MKTTLKICIPLLLLVALSSWIYSGEDDGYFTYLRGKKQYVVVQRSGEPTIVFLTGKGRDCKDLKKCMTSLKRSIKFLRTIEQGSDNQNHLEEIEQWIPWPLNYMNC